MRNSASFDAAKNVRERLEVNYSSAQLMYVLDRLLFRAVTPLLKNTTYLDNALLDTAAWYSKSQRRKLSGFDKPQFLTQCLEFCTSVDVLTKAALWKRMGLERSLVLYLLQNWLASPSHYTGDNLYRDRGHVLFWYNAAVEFRSQIAEKYLRHAMREAQKYYASQSQGSGDRLDPDDLMQNYTLAVMRAIDKLDPTKGTLTSYVNHWMRDASTNSKFRYESGVAFNLNSAQRRATASGDGISNYSLSSEVDPVHEDDTDEKLEQAGVVKYVRELSRKLDPTGLGRLYLEIGETLKDTHGC